MLQLVGIEGLWRDDRCEEAIAMLSELQAKYTNNAVIRERLARYQERVAHLRSEQAYFNYYSAMAAEHPPGELSEVVWRAMWIADRVRSLAQWGDMRTLIDIGCGNGEMTLWFANTPGLTKVMGVDLVPLCIERAREDPRNTPHTSYEVCDAEKLNEKFDENSFDIAVLGGILEHVRDPDEVLHQAKRVVRPGGAIFINVPFGGFSYYGEPDTKHNQHVRFWNPYEKLWGEHMEIEYKSHYGDPNLPWAQHGEIGDFGILLWNR